jgi:hypothetical protein
MRHWKWFVPAAAAAGILAVATAQAAPKRPAGRGGGSAAVQRGEYLVTVGGCNDCHTPWKMGQNGPEPDMTRMLSGHPQELTMPEPPKPVGPWIASASGTFTAWAGPWGTSYSANLTPDPETGLGKWTEQNFIESMRTGKHMGRGRPILPPMPWPNLAKATDADLKAMFAYLRSIPAIPNQVPEPVAPAEPPASAGQGTSAPPGQGALGGSTDAGSAPQGGAATPLPGTK